MNQKIKAVLGFLVSGAVLTAIDQWTKSLAVAGLKGKVLQYSRSSHYSLFCHMTDDENGDSFAFCDLHQQIGRLPHLTDTSRR